MTVKELRDRLDDYIKRDPPGLWQLNDVEADAAAYAERCTERSRNEVIILDDGMKPKHFSLLMAFGTTICPMDKHGKFKEKEVFALSTDLTDEIK